MAESLEDLLGTMADLVRQADLKNDSIAELRTKAQRGDRAAALRLGDIYAQSKNFKEAFKYYAIPAEGGNTEAMCHAGMMAMSARYHQAASKNERYYYQSEAVRFFERAAENGRIDAAFRLGKIYTSDDFISQKLFSRRENLRKGIEWTMRAAKKSYPQAQYHLALCYREGVGVKPSIDEEFFWARCAQINGSKEANEYLKVLSGAFSENVMEYLLEKFNAAIAKHPEYIEFYHIRQKAREYAQNADNED